MASNSLPSLPYQSVVESDNKKFDNFHKQILNFIDKTVLAMNNLQEVIEKLKYDIKVIKENLQSEDWVGANTTWWEKDGLIQCSCPSNRNLADKALSTANYQISELCKEINPLDEEYRKLKIKLKGLKRFLLFANFPASYIKENYNKWEEAGDNWMELKFHLLSAEKDLISTFSPHLSFYNQFTNSVENKTIKTFQANNRQLLLSKFENETKLLTSDELKVYYDSYQTTELEGEDGQEEKCWLRRVQQREAEYRRSGGFQYENPPPEFKFSKDDFPPL